LNSKISNKDKEAWKKFLSSKESLPDKDKNIKKEIKKTISFDLHGYSLDEANKKIYSLIHEAFDNRISKMVIVTGKGIHSDNYKDPYISKDLGILKNSVPEFIKSNPSLMNKINEIKEADIIDGGSGAFYIFLKKKIIK
tara:strand:- start:899 stop:1315 length:417 start_codon:yes stop_codon:yes gene_type:complete